MNKALLVAMLVLAIALPATAQEALITDPCGDLLLQGHVQDEPVTTPGDLTKAFDIAAGTIISVDGGVDASIDVCGDAVTPEHTQSYEVRWAVGESCKAMLRLNRKLDVKVGSDETRFDHDPHASFEHTCTEPAKDGELFGTATTVFRIELPDTAWTIEGNRVTFRLRSAELPAVAASLLDPGTTWSGIHAVGRYLPASGAGTLFVRDAQGAAYVRMSDGADFADTEQAFVVGS